MKKKNLPDGIFLPYLPTYKQARKQTDQESDN